MEVYQMQNYPNYYPSNPYFDRMNFLQNYQQNMFPTQMSVSPNYVCKIVDSIDVVRATDIPMDGNAYYFPKADGSEIYSKQWQSNGQTRLLTFKPVLDNNPNNTTLNAEKSFLDLSDTLTKALYERFDTLESKIDSLKPKKEEKSK